MQQYANITVEHLKVILMKLHGILAVMVGVVYDSVVFKTESEVGRNVHEYIEERRSTLLHLGHLHLKTK